MSTVIKNIKKDRVDLNDYLIHFIRDSEEQTAFNVLQNIINEGYLNCGWSIREGKKTIFGSKPAVCFTEMPLCSFFDYVTKRADIKKVNNYGIALLTEDLFIKGARNVIYGTTNETVEKVDNNDNGYLIEYSADATIPERRAFPNKELYRYMLTKINDTNDWTHEREWRWIDSQNKTPQNFCLPIWSYQEANLPDKEFTDFRWQTIIIITQYDDEVPKIQALLQSKKTNDNFNNDNIVLTKIISREKLMNSGLPAYFGFRDVLERGLFTQV